MKIAVFGAISYLAAVTSAVHLEQDGEGLCTLAEEELMLAQSKSKSKSHQADAKKSNNKKGSDSKKGTDSKAK